MSAYVSLLEKGVPFMIETVDLDAEQQTKEPFRSRSLTCRIPTIEHQSLCLSESSAIAEYLDEVFPAPGYPSLLPRDLIARARARQVQAWLRSDLTAICEERPTSIVFLGAHSEKRLSDKAREAADKLFTVADALIHNGNRTLADGWCVADLDLALMLNRLVFNEDAVPKKLKDYATHQWERPSVQRWVKHERRRKSH